MKYLKTFKIFESSSEEDLLGTINDIFISLDDSGIEYKIEKFDNIGLIHIKINGQNELVEDCIDHLENYLKDLDHLYFVGRAIKGETHISIENNFNKEIEKDFLKIIEGIREVKNPKNEKSRLWIGTDNYILFELSRISPFLYYNHDKIYDHFLSLKYNLSYKKTGEVVRYLVGKHLKIEALKPSGVNWESGYYTSGDETSN